MKVSVTGWIWPIMIWNRQKLYCRTLMLDKTTVINTVERYADVVKKEFSPFAVILFGSYVNGVPHEDSDIDVGVVFDGFTGDWLEASAKLWRLRHDVSWDIEPHLLDVKQDDSGFVKHVFKTGHIIYQAE